MPPLKYEKGFYGVLGTLELAKGALCGGPVLRAHIAVRGEGSGKMPN